MRPGIGAGIGALPVSALAPLVSPRLDIQVEGGDHSVAFFVAARFSTFVVSPSLFAPTIEAGARWHVSRKITLGLAIGTGIALLLARDGGSVFLVGATIEPFTWSFTPNHEVGLAISGFLPVGTPGVGASGPFFNVLVEPTVGYTFRFK